MGLSRVLALPLKEALQHPEFAALVGKIVPKGYNWVTPLITAEVGLETWRMASHWWGEKKNDANTKAGIKALEKAAKVGERLDTTDKNLAKIDERFLALQTQLAETNRLLAAQKAKLGTVEVAKPALKPTKVAPEIPVVAV